MVEYELVAILKYKNDVEREIHPIIDFKVIRMFTFSYISCVKENNMSLECKVTIWNRWKSLNDSKWNHLKYPLCLETLLPQIARKEDSSTQQRVPAHEFQQSTSIYIPSQWVHSFVLPNLNPYISSAVDCHKGVFHDLELVFGKTAWYWHGMPFLLPCRRVSIFLKSFCVPKGRSIRRHPLIIWKECFIERIL